MAGYKCNHCGNIKDTYDLHKWNIDGDTICKACYRAEQRVEEEYNRLQMLYPLFDFFRDGEHVTAVMSNNSSYHFTIKHGRLDHESSMHLDRDHLRKSMSRQLMSIYQSLYISIYPDRENTKAHVWIKRDGRDSEAIGNIDVLSPYFHKTLERWDLQASQALEDGWFFCSGHQTAEPRSEFGYFHFAGNYCKEWAEAHPEAAKEAARETYN